MFKKVLVLLVGMALVLSMVSVGISADPAAPMNPKVKEMIDSARAAIKIVPRRGGQDGHRFEGKGDLPRCPRCGVSSPPGICRAR